MFLQHLPKRRRRRGESDATSVIAIVVVIVVCVAMIGGAGVLGWYFLSKGDADPVVQAQPEITPPKFTAPPGMATPVEAGPKVGETAPDIVGEDIDGVEFKLSDYRGKVVMLDFWGHW